MPGPSISTALATGGVSATDLWLSRGGREILRGARLEVPRACVTALIAPSGAGKSTLLRCVTRLLDPDRGTITVGGQDVQTIPPRELRRRVGLVAQRATMFPGTVGDNVAYALEGVGPAHDRVRQAIEAAGLVGDWASRAADELSGGEQARVAIARALVRDPEVLLLDEPTAALDHETGELVGATLRRLAEDGIGICLAIHDLPFARRFADRAVHLDGSDATEAGRDEAPAA
ncbi:MAG: ATP-binding cassette domain-containing protein [Solirubrobacteraceae bacterium]|nr:ATP-binding cassette domain-containing protein [Solirubrobacteraceae bacterium]